MSGDHSIYSTFVELAQYGLCNGSSGSRLGTASELIDKHKRTRICCSQHCLHIHKERTVRTQVVVDGLVISYAHHYPVEHGKLRGFRSRYEHSPLEHILKQSYSLQAYGFSSCVRTGYEQNVLLRSQSDSKRYDCLLLLSQSSFQKRMSCLAQIQLPVIGYNRHSRNEIQGYLLPL